MTPRTTTGRRLFPGLNVMQKFAATTLADILAIEAETARVEMDVILLERAIEFVSTKAVTLGHDADENLTDSQWLAAAYAREYARLAALPHEQRLDAKSPARINVVYIAHPLRGDWDGNVAMARRYAHAALLAGYAPVAPYLMGLPLDDEKPLDRILGLSHDLAVIPKCDEIWLCGDRLSEGMRAEMEMANQLGIWLRSVTLSGETLVFGDRQPEA